MQVIFAMPSENGHDYAMRIFNSDGSEPEMCGNGIRCLAKFVADIDQNGADLHKVHTLAGRVFCAGSPHLRTSPAVRFSDDSAPGTTDSTMSNKR